MDCYSHLYTSLFGKAHLLICLNEKASNEYTLDKLRVGRTMKMQKGEKEQNTNLPINASY